MSVPVTGGEGSAPFVQELVRLLTFFEYFPITSPMSVLTIAIEPGRPPEFVIQLPATSTSMTLRALDEWAIALTRVALIAWRAPDGATAEIGVRGSSDEGGPTLQVWSRPIPYHELHGLRMDPGSIDQIDGDLSHLWAVR